MPRLMAPVLGLVLTTLTGCAAYTSAFYGSGPASTDYVQCSKDNAGYGQIPDFGITYAQHFNKCMSEAGWEQSRQAQGARLGPYGLSTDAAMKTTIPTGDDALRGLQDEGETTPFSRHSRQR